MMRLLLCSLFLMAAYLDIHAQWVVQNSGAPRDLHGVFFVDNKTGVVVGEKATIIRTDNGGLVWDSITAGFTGDPLYNDVNFPTATTGYIVGYVNGMHTILKTTNGGSTWNTQVTNGTDELYSISFVDAQMGLTAGANGAIYRTTNGGSSYSKINSGTTTKLFDVHFADANNAYVVGVGGTILKSSDGGQSWNSQTSNTISDLHRVYFTSATHGFAVGETGEFITTTDGGLTWQDRTTGFARNLYALHCLNDSTCFAGGEDGLIIMTTDTGNSWKVMFQGDDFEAQVNAIHLPSTDIGFVVGDIDAFNSGNGLIKKNASPLGTFITYAEVPPLTIYPNPMRDFAMIDLSQMHQQGYMDLHITLTDLSGRVCAQNRIRTNPYALHRGTLSPGMYLIQLATPNQEILGRGRVVVE